MALSRGPISPRIYACSAGTANDICGPAAPSFIPPDRRTKILRAAQLLLGHSKLESTVRYLGIEVDDAFEMAEQTEV